MNIKFYQVDAFTNSLFSGNPAGVIFSNIDNEVFMQQIAYENNLSETAFISKHNDEYFIRWFTPDIEVDLCGHATLAAAFVYFNFINTKSKNFIVNSRSGILEVIKDGSMLHMNFPIDSLAECNQFLEIENFLGKKPNQIFKGKDDYLCIFEDESDILDLSPNFILSDTIKCRGVIASAQSKNYDFVSRCFFPMSGVNEDPVTGSAHTTLIPYWAKVLNKNRLVAKQVSKRGGILHCRLNNDRVIISGEAILYLSGQIFLDLN